MTVTRGSVDDRVTALAARAKGALAATEPAAVRDPFKKARLDNFRVILLLPFIRLPSTNIEPD